MTSKLEIIGIDHGWSMMKGTNDVFVTGSLSSKLCKSFYSILFFSVAL